MVLVAVLFGGPIKCPYAVESVFQDYAFSRLNRGAVVTIKSIASKCKVKRRH